MTEALVADIGGTHARFGLFRDGVVTRRRALRCADYSGFAMAAENYLASLDQEGAPSQGAIAVAGPVLGDRVAMTNHPWAFSIRDTRRRLGLARLEVINDFAALAEVVPVLRKSEARSLRPGNAQTGCSMAVLGPGTGLGMAAVVPCGDRWITVAGEGGHCDLAPTNEREWEVFNALRRRFGRVSAERVLCGPGLLNLYAALCDATSPGAPPAEPEALSERARDGDPVALEALDLFGGWLGAVAGDLALTVGARGGVYIGGGVVPRLGELFAVDRFTQRFLAKGRFEDYLEPIPVQLIVDPAVALRGAALALVR